MQPIYDKYYQRYKDYAEQKKVAFQGFDKISVDKSGDCILCNTTYLDAIKEIKSAVFAIINRGIFPEVTREEFYNKMPYLDKIYKIDITDEELKKIIEIIKNVINNYFYNSN